LLARKKSEISKMNLVPLSALLRKGIGLQLDPDGTIVVYTSEPVVIRRAGRWRGLFWKPVAAELHKRYGELGSKLFDVSRRLSLSGRGGIFAIITNSARSGKASVKRELAQESTGSQ
jgi:hypothetical protein